MSKTIYIIMVDEWVDGYCATQVTDYHETLEGALESFDRRVEIETANFMMNEFGVDAYDEETLNAYEVVRGKSTYSDGTEAFSIESSPRTVCVNIYKRELQP